MVRASGRQQRRSSAASPGGTAADSEHGDRPIRIGSVWWAGIGVDAVLTVAAALTMPPLGVVFVVANAIAGAAIAGLLRRAFLGIALLGALALAVYGLMLVGITTTTTVGPVTRL